MKNRVVHFEIQAENIDRAIKFYQDVFGWQITRWEQNPYWMVMTADKDSKEPGINGGLLPRPTDKPMTTDCGTNYFVCTIQVDNYDAMGEKIVAAGGKVAMPKYALAGMAWQGYFIDTEGNTFGLHQLDKNAK